MIDQTALDHCSSFVQLSYSDELCYHRPNSKHSHVTSCPTHSTADGLKGASKHTRWPCAANKPKAQGQNSANNTCDRMTGPLIDPTGRPEMCRNMLCSSTQPRCQKVSLRHNCSTWPSGWSAGPVSPTAAHVHASSSPQRAHFITHNTTQHNQQPAGYLLYPKMKLPPARTTVTAALSQRHVLHTEQSGAVDHTAARLRSFHAVAIDSLQHLLAAWAYPAHKLPQGGPRHPRSTAQRKLR